MQDLFTTQEPMPESRARVARLVTSTRFQQGVIGLILLNAVTLGLETSATVTAAIGPFLDFLDGTLLLLFTGELALRIFAFRGRFFRNPWDLFDLAVIGFAWAPATEGLSVLRSLRILRALRLLSVVPSLRYVVEAMLAALPGMGSIILLMGLMLYIFGVMATKLFGEGVPEQFGTLGTSIFTLFQLMTLEGWVAEIVNPAIAVQPLALLFFIPFIIISTFIVLNLFLGVIVESIQTLRETRESADAEAAQAATEAAIAAANDDTRMLMAEIRDLRRDIAALRAEKR